MLKPVHCDPVFFILSKFIRFYPVLSGFIPPNLFFSVFFCIDIAITKKNNYICECQTQKISKKWKQKTRKTLKINNLH